MQYAKYDEYSPSRLEWVDTIPKQWDITRLRLISRRYSGGTPSKDKPEYWQEGTVPWLNSGAVNQGTITQPSEYITELGLKESSAKWIPEHAVIIALAGQGKTKGTAAYTTFKATCNQSMGVVVFEKDHPRYMYWWLVSQYKNIRGMASDDSRDGLNLEMLGTIPCPLPSIEEQQKIAVFLDYKTQQIDQLIEKKKALIEKLEEKRIAMITQAVTKGLDENVKLKPSGVNWLGAVPAHWDLRRLKYLSQDTLQYGANEAAEMDDRDQPRFIRITDVKADGSLHEETFRSIPQDIAEPFILSEGDILLARSGATVGKSFIYSEGWGVAAYAGYLIRFRVDLNIMSADFAYQFFQTSTFWANINSTLIKSTIQNFSAEKYANILMPLPPKNEQEKIINFLNQNLKKLDAMARKANDAIEKLEEYRSAIITSAVTGKIDVRVVDIPQSAA